MRDVLPLILRPGRGISGGSLGPGRPGRARAVAFWAAVSLAPPAGRARAGGIPGERPRPRVARLAEFLADDAGFQKAYQRSKLEAPTSTSWPAAGDDVRRRGRRHHGRCRRSPRRPSWPSSWSSSRTSSTGSPTARPASAPTLDEPLRHYRYRWVAKPSGSLRLIEAPKPRLKQLQRRLLDAILSAHPAARRRARLSSRAGRSRHSSRLMSAGRSCSRWTSATSSFRSRAPG